MSLRDQIHEYIAFHGDCTAKHLSEVFGIPVQEAQAFIDELTCN